MKNKLIRIVLIIVILAGFCVVPDITYAKAYTETYHQEETRVLTAWNSCLGGMKGTLTYDATFHVTENKNGYHSILLMNGTSLVEPLPGNTAFTTFTGKFTEKITQHATDKQDFMVQVVTQREDNLVFHITFKISWDEGVPSVDVFKTACGE